MNFEETHEGSHFSGLNFRTAFIAGGSAGDHTVTGITEKDYIVQVFHISADFTDEDFSAEDLTDEFSIDSEDTVNNDNGTDTSNGLLFFLYLKGHPNS